MGSISINKKNHTKKIYDKTKETRIFSSLEENLKIICYDKKITKLGFTKEFLREKLISFKNETDKNAVWDGKVTKTFHQYLIGQKIYKRSKERISFYISKQRKKYWKDFIKNNEFITSLSKLIRDGVDYYIQHHLNSSFIESNMNNKNFSDISFILKEPLTAIKGFSELLLKEFNEELNKQAVSNIENIYEQCLVLESKILNNQKGQKFDVLLIEDGPSTMRLIEEIFKIRGCSFKIATTGLRGLNELKKSIPKLVLLDIILPDIEGYEVCKQIKANNNLKHVPVFYLTAIPDEIVRSKIEETGADGYILKPFDLSAITELLDTIA
ncbi:MAG: response regulator [Promethearchaeota archaeon]